MKDIAIVAAALILALAILFGNRFELHGSDRTGLVALRLDNLTGEVVLCAPEGTASNRNVRCE